MQPSREEHLKFCKMRALRYVDAGDLSGAVASMISDMNKRDDCRVDLAISLIGLFDAQAGNTDGVRKFIEGFR